MTINKKMLEERLATVDEALDNMQNGEQEEEEKPRLRDLFPRTSAEIRVLLS